MDTGQSRLSHAPPTAPVLPAARRPHRTLCCSPTPSFPNAASSPTGTSCRTPPYPEPAAPSVRRACFRHSERSEESLCAFAATPRRASLLQLVSPPPLSPPDKMAPPHTTHSYPSEPRRASSRPPPP